MNIVKIAKQQQQKLTLASSANKPVKSEHIIVPTAGKNIIKHQQAANCQMLPKFLSLLPYWIKYAKVVGARPILGFVMNAKKNLNRNCVHVQIVGRHLQMEDIVSHVSLHSNLSKQKTIVEIVLL